jgi:alpha-L-fucosidase
VKQAILNDTEEVQPTEAQKKFLDLRFGMFIHFGINTFYNTEISKGDLPLHNFDTKYIDTNQWCSIAKNAGMKYILITAKSVDGFCNWHSKYSKYSVANTRYKRDILAEVVDSAERNGLKIGFSYSLWDNHVFNNQLDENIYNEFILNQIQELLTTYGPLVELWFDGFWHRHDFGWKAESGFAVSQDKFIKSWRMEGAYRWGWDYIYAFCKSIQPDCLIFNNPTRFFRGLPLLPVDGRAAEKGEDLEQNQNVWSWLGNKVFLPLQIETTLSQRGEGAFIDGNWFWHNTDKSVAKKWKIKNWRKNAEKIGANLLLNVGPMSNGQIRPEDQKTLLKLRKD